MKNWVRTSEQMPKVMADGYSDYVLFIIGHDTYADGTMPEIHLGCRHIDDFGMEHWYDYLYASGIRRLEDTTMVTHWMPLPEMPDWNEWWSEYIKQLTLWDDSEEG